MPVRDAAATLDMAVASILRQTLNDFELIAVNDGGGSLGILEKYARRDSRVKVVPLPPTGIVGAINAGIAEAKAPFIARMDADDLSHPRRLELQIKYMVEHKDR
jgi:glycosyltransferase involved in cell wall biosynthesis